MDYKRWTNFCESQIKEAESAFKVDGVKKELEFGLLYVKANLALHLSECESPIEQILFTTLYFSGIEQFGWMTLVRLYTQKPIEIAGHTYRADILVEAYDSQKSLKIIVECDGHDFHEKTKEQAKRDKRRDRHFITAGYHVLRFTGSEIVNDPHECVKDISKLIEFNFPCPL